MHSTLRLPDTPETIFWLDPSKLPAYWKTGTLNETQSILTDWLLDPFCLALGVPSVVMELSYNILLHPAHADFGEVAVVGQRVLGLDVRLGR